MLRLIVVSRLHIVAIAFMGTLTFGWLFTGERPWLLATICGFDWFIVNLLNRVVDQKEDQVNAIEGTEFAGRHGRPLTVLGFGLLLGSFVLSHLWMPAITPWRIGYHLLGVVYNWRLLPGRRRLKELYFFKNTASASGFMITLFAYPLAVASAAGGPNWPAGIGPMTVLMAALFFFPFELSYEVIYDLRDREGDAAANVRSFPVVHGVDGAVRIIDALLFCSSVAMIGGYAMGWVPWRLFIMIAAPLMQAVFYKRALKRGITARDCILLTWLGAFLLAAYHLWVHLGLPGVGL